MLNGSALNSATLNGVPARREPVVVDRYNPGAQVGGVSAPPTSPVDSSLPGASYIPAPLPGIRWRLRVVVGGEDVTALLTGKVTEDREENAAGLASFELHLPQSRGPFVPTAWKGKSVTLDFYSTSRGETVVSRRYTGYLAEPSWNPRTRILSCQCSDQRQQRVEALGIPTIDALIPGYWSEDVFEPLEGRSHWDYAEERLSTIPASLDCSPTGGLRVTSWIAADAPHFVFGPGTTLDDSVSVDLASLDTQTNWIEVKADCRFPRLWQKNESYSWQHPGTGGYTGIQGFCEWVKNSTELPDKSMIEGCASNGGQTMISPTYYDLPPSAADPCGTGFRWENVQEGLLLGCSWVGARRWVQTCTETYSCIVTTDPALTEDQRIVERQGYSLSIESDRAEAWESDPITSGATGAEDLRDDARRDALLNVALHTARTDIIRAHRQTTLSWSVSASLAVGVDLIHTLEIDDQGVKARGKCRQIRTEFDLQSGTAIATLSIAVMQGGGASDPLTLPAAAIPAYAPSGSGDGIGGSLPTQLGGALDSPPYDDEKDGFSGNYSLPAAEDLEVYPRRMTITADEIAAADRDELTATVETTYRVGVPADVLEL